MADQTHLQAAQQHAQRGRFPQMLAECRCILEAEDIQPASLLEMGVLLFNFGFLSQAQVCFDKARALSPDDLVPTINLANVARDMGNHAEARALYSKLLAQLPDHPVIRRNDLPGNFRPLNS
jgi:tetratricopeptide (TPR) repeat protein